jgi:hypothetical protein
MRAKYAAFMAALGIAFFFIFQLSGTLFRNIYSDISIIRITSILSVLAAAAVLYFYIAFYRDYVEKDQKRLKRAAVWAMAGTGAVLLMYFGFMHNNLNLGLLPEIFRAGWFQSAGPLFPWFSVLCLLYFYMMFYIEDGHDEKRHIPRAKQLALAGAGLAVLLRSIIGIGYLAGGTLRWISDLRGVLFPMGLILAVLGFLAAEYFFLSFYKGSDLFRE